jgi:predicted nucleotidyltransferase
MRNKIAAAHQAERIEPGRHVPREVIEAAARQIVDKFDPERVILFGSYAYGQPRSGSDVDMSVIMDTPLKEAEQAANICRGIDYHFGLELIVRTPATLARRLDLGDFFLREVVAKGEVLYERPDR